MKERSKRVLVGMSGGIDSTATCLMLQEQGYEIVGVTMRVWGDAYTATATTSAATTIIILWTIRCCNRSSNITIMSS